MADSSGFVANCERWLPVVDAMPWYEVSDRGRVCSREHDIQVTRWGQLIPTHYKEQFLSLRPTKKGYVRVGIVGQDGVKKVRAVQQLVLEAFVGPCPPGMTEALHNDDDKSNNWIGNLRWGTHADNMQDMIRNGNNPGRNRKRCPFEHLLMPPNLVPAMLRRGRRVCLTCNRARTNVRNCLARGKGCVDLAERQRHHYTELMLSFEDEAAQFPHLMDLGVTHQIAA